MAEEEKEKEFTVTDRRTSSAESPAEPGEKPEADKEGDDPKKGEKQTSDAGTGHTEEPAGQFPEVDFTSFILSLATTAQMSLGAIPNPETKETKQNLPAAKQMIDILGMLKEKTTGNLNEQEQTLLEQALYGLRMQYVKMMESKQ